MKEVNATVTRAIVRRPDEVPRLDCKADARGGLVRAARAGRRAGYGFVDRGTKDRRARRGGHRGSRRAGASVYVRLRLGCSSCAALLFCCRCAVAMSKDF